LYRDAVLPGVIRNGEEIQSLSVVEYIVVEPRLNLDREIYPVIVSIRDGYYLIDRVRTARGRRCRSQADIQLIIHVFFYRIPAIGDADIVDIEDAVFGEEQGLRQLYLEVAVADAIPRFVFGVDVNFLHG
jgi:hypothetical protein